MTSLKQIDANRRNALKSTGPITPEGKESSRCNAVRHGLTAETVIGSLEDAEDYAAFESAVIADYDAETAVQGEFVLRPHLAGLSFRREEASTSRSCGRPVQKAGHFGKERNGIGFEQTLAVG